ncbi:hypothetical protein LWM68_11585 [Niabella sp. W65]|nr:hypothetical protein [Niabella sp. W65]MCH7363336.1 hypothetical protein [Niabella sp. W65]ULT39260.1 hypothetical protein KRR40_30335 [Niabella sp. I65]
MSSEDELVRLIEKERESGIFLSVLGFGTGNYQDNNMQQLADRETAIIIILMDCRKQKSIGK